MEIETNSPAVQATAATVWSRYPRLTEGPAIRLRIAVSPVAEVSPSVDAPRIRFDTDWICVDHGPDNRALACLAEGWGEIALTANRAADFDYFRYHFLEPLAYLLLAPPHFAFVHAACVALNGRAMVLCGEAAAGKTCLAFACARLGWTYVSGDATHCLHNHTGFTLAGRPYSIRFRESARDLFPELNACPAALRPNQRLSIEADTEMLSIATAPRARASHLVFLERRSTGAAGLGSMSPGETMRRLEESVMFGGAVIRENQRATLRRFAALPSVRLVYSSLHDAESALRTLIAEEAS